MGGLGQRRPFPGTTSSNQQYKFPQSLKLPAHSPRCSVAFLGKLKKTFVRTKERCHRVQVGIYVSALSHFPITSVDFFLRLGTVRVGRNRDWTLQEGSCDIPPQGEMLTAPIPMALISSILFYFFTMPQVKVSCVSFLLHLMVTIVTLKLKEAVMTSQAEWNHPRHSPISGNFGGGGQSTID